MYFKIVRPIAVEILPTFSKNNFVSKVIILYPFQQVSMLMKQWKYFWRGWIFLSPRFRSSFSIYKTSYGYPNNSVFGKIVTSTSNKVDHTVENKHFQGVFKATTLCAPVRPWGHDPGDTPLGTRPSSSKPAILKQVKSSSSGQTPSK